MPRQNSIRELPKLSIRNLQNAFQVESDTESNQYYYNLLETVHIDGETLEYDSYFEYITKRGDSLMSISSRFYQTLDLYWIVGVVNKIVNPFSLEVGTTLRILKPSVAKTILTSIDRG